MNWKLTLVKGLAVGGLAMLAVVVTDVQMASPWYAGLVGLAAEVLRDLIKTRFGRFLPD